MSNQLQINDRTYTFGTVPPVEAIRVEVAIARVIGEPLFKAFTDGNVKDQAAANEAAAAAIGLLASKMDADELLATMGTVFKYVGIAGQKTTVDINADFMGRNRELWQVLIAALKFNFADFLPAGLLTSIRDKMPASS